MPRLVNRTPKMWKHRSSGHAAVTLCGKDYFLGPFGSRSARIEYDRLVKAWLDNGRRYPVVEPDETIDFTVTEIVDSFWTWAKIHYRKPNGTPTSEQGCYKQVLRLLHQHYGEIPAKKFGPRKLDEMVERMCSLGWTRQSINGHIKRVQFVFAHGVRREMIPKAVHDALLSVKGLEIGRMVVKEGSKVKPVADEVVNATLPHLPPVVAAMIEVQRFSAARPSEVCNVRTCDITFEDSIFVYRPHTHKSEHLERDRIIYFGPRAQAILKPFLKPLNPAAYIFSPRESEAVRRQEQHARRTTPLSYGNRPGSNRKANPKRAPRDRYDVGSYRRAIQRACDLAFPAPAPLVRLENETAKQRAARLTPAQHVELHSWQKNHRWHPHQLRHTAGTSVRHKLGIEAAQSVLGHATLDATEIYAERSTEQAKEIACAIG